MDCKIKHKRRDNKFGITWCVNCGMLAFLNPDYKPKKNSLNLNFVLTAKVLSIIFVLLGKV